MDNDFYSVSAGNSLYVDPEFTGDNALYWADAGEEKMQMAVYKPHLDWTRLSKVYPDVTLFGDNGVTPGDLRQGSIGNCWVMSGASAVAEVPGRIEKLFLNNSNSLNANGIYGVNIYALGVPHTILVDDFLPLKASTEKTFFAHIGDD